MVFPAMLYVEKLSEIFSHLGQLALSDQVPQAGYLKAVGMHPFTFPRLDSKAKVGRTVFPLQTFRGHLSPPFPASGIFSNTWCSLSCCDIFGVCLHHLVAVFSVCPCVLISFLPGDHYSLDLDLHSLTFFSCCYTQTP